MSSEIVHTIESLEARRLLAGVTLITHGLQTGGRPAWLDQMTDAVAARLGGASVYRLVVGPTGTSGVAQVSSFTRISAGLSTSAESVIELDWSSVSNFLSNPVYTGQVASLVLPYLTTAQSLAGDPNTQHAFAEVPIHLIGHSRGASLVSDLARQLGTQGAWVDDLTLLDAYPVGSDPAVSIGDNVAFADNFYETGDFIVHGSTITGTHNVNLTSLSGMSHSNVHTYYHGTIDRAATSADGLTINNSWYSGATTGPRYSVGFDWSDFGATPRPTDGVGTNFGGGTSRAGVNVTAPQPWSNVGDVRIAGGTTNGRIAAGESLTLSYRYADVNGDGDTVGFFIDNDTNPYNGSTASLGSEAVPATSAGAATSRNFGITWPTSLGNGLYHLFAKISDSIGHARYAMLSTPISVSGAADAARVIAKRWTGNVDANWSNPSNWTPGGTPSAASRVSVDSGSINVSSSVAALSIDAHGGSLVVGSTGAIDASLFADGNASIAFNSSQQLDDLSLDDAATLDLGANGLIVAYTGASPLSSVEGFIRTARNGGAWTGAGLTSSAARNNVAGNTTLGAMESTDYPGSTFAGRTIPARAVLIKYTYYGDANFDGRVTFDDYVRIDTGFNAGRTGWSNGDFNLDGAVNFDDYVLIDVAFNTQGAALGRGTRVVRRPTAEPWAFA